MDHGDGETTRHWWINELNNLELIRGEKSGHNYPRHFHSGFSIGIINDGLREYTYGGNKHLAPAGSIVIINPGVTHSCAAENSCYETICPGDWAVSYWLGGGGRMTGRFRFREQDIQDQQLFTGLRNLFCILKQPGLSLEKQSLYTAIMAELFNRYAEKTANLANVGNERHAVTKCREYIDDKYSLNISLEELSSLVGFSPYHLLRVFTRQIGLPPHVYQTQVRIKRARGLLATGESLADVAVAAGFSDQAHFTRCFKKHMGVTPGRYQRMLTLDGELY